MSQYLTTRKIQEMVVDPEVTKQDMANLMHDFRDREWWVHPLIANRRRVLATFAAIFGLGLGGGRWGIPALDRFWDQRVNGKSGERPSEQTQQMTEDEIRQTIEWMELKQSTQKYHEP